MISQIRSGLDAVDKIYLSDGDGSGQGWDRKMGGTLFVGWSRAWLHSDGLICSSPHDPIGEVKSTINLYNCHLVDSVHSTHRNALRKTE